MHQLTKAHIRLLFGETTYNRGERYFKQRRVSSLRITRLHDGNVINAIVQGSRPYEVNAIVDCDAVGKIESSCSCPMGSRCKHVVAMLLAYLPHQKQQNNNTLPKLKSEIDRWLEGFDELTKPKTQPNNTPEHYQGSYFLTYRLFSANHLDDLLFYKSKYLKNGTLSQGTKLDSYKAVDDYYYRDIKDENDYNILSMLHKEYKNQYYSYSSNHVKFQKSQFWYDVLKRIIATNRAYYDTQKEPLVWREKVFEPQIEFKKYKGLYSLKSNVHTKKHKLIPTQPALLLDKHNNTIQEFGMDTALYNKLLSLPKIKLDDISKVYGSIAKVAPTVQTPKEIETKRIDTLPQIHLTLLYEKINMLTEYHQMRLYFSYEGYELDYYPQHPIHSRFEGSRQIEIVRHLESENAARERLSSFGFELERQGEQLYAKALGSKQTSLAIWKTFLHTHIPTLQAQGWVIEFDKNFGMKFESNAQVVVESEESNDWFSLGFNLEFNGTTQPIAPLIGSIIDEFDDLTKLPKHITIDVDNHHYVQVPSEQIAPIIQTILELYNKEGKEGNFELNPFDAHLIENLDESVIWKGSKEILALSKKLKDFKGIEHQAPPKALNATLRDYQQEGLDWLGFLHAFNFGGILADDMGLGKTIQTLAHLSRLKENGELDKPSLVVVPTSLIANWRNECAKFTPNLSLLSLHGIGRMERFEEIENHDIVLSTYALIPRDEERLKEYHFEYIILDEAQKIKNPKAKMTVAIKKLKCNYRLALSGTPIENHLGELWSIFSFAMPGFLDTYSLFKQFYQNPIEKDKNITRQTQLNRRLKPFILRRTKERVAHELPAKSEIIKYTQFESKQSKLYETIRVTMEQRVKDAISQKGLASSHITILDALLKLRQVCCDPSLLKVDEAKKLKESAKLTLFLDLIDELLEEGRKILVFSQFTSMLSILESEIKKRKIKYTKLTGATRKREEAIEEFTSGKADIFLISLKAGGVGLNLTQADTVIHYDPWWNPAVENQATDRAYRIGQDKKVFVYKLIVENTIEQKILELQKQKEALQQGIYEEGEAKEMKFKGDELLELLKQ